ncbi:response regulator [Planctopirus limnophila]|nr:response regulator [Planctopirus limnophila]
MIDIYRPDTDDFPQNDDRTDPVPTRHRNQEGLRTWSFHGAHLPLARSGQSTTDETSLAFGNSGQTSIRPFEQGFSRRSLAGTGSSKRKSLRQVIHSRGGQMINTETVGRPMEILLVEDSLMFSRIAIGALKNSHLRHRLTWVTDGEQALEFLHQRGIYQQAPRPDLIFLDLGLPGIDGRDVLAELRAEEQIKSIPVVIMTASTDEATFVETEKLQVQGYLTKPLDIEKFNRLMIDLNQFWHQDMILPRTAN